MLTRLVIPVLYSLWRGCSVPEEDGPVRTSAARTVQSEKF
ncbi:MAG: hypothetical protein OJF52_001778 [Nitrospira sp.]|nr:MAG: hypothetical protein OJF52_001778 [Nitrospira sp.]